MEMISSDSAYDSNNHEYVWYIGSIPNWGSGSVSLTVVVNSNAIHGMNLTNITELYDGESLVATATEKTLVCCLENPTTTIYVDKYATGANLGLDWPNAYNSLNNALIQAGESVCDTNFTIFVAQGTYSPGGSEDDRFVLPDEISVYGGFPTGGCDFNLRNPKRYLTILSGTIDRFLRNGTVLEMGDNCLIDGFTISEAGEYCIHGSGVDFSIAQCTIENSDQYGIYASNSNIDLAWCIFRNNRDGIMHSGAGYILNVDNCWLMKQRQIGITCESSTPMLRNSIVTESDLSETGNAGIRMVNPSSQPVFQNCTISHNKSVGISLAGIGTPSLVNSIVYHNNSGGPQLSTNLNPDVVAQYCCIADCNEVNNNINIDPKFVYYDPNNVRIQSNSPCHDSGLTLSENYTQVDMDNRIRVLGFAVDRGAYEIECEDTNHELDWNHDGLVNMVEFNVLARAWQSRDPNDPAIITDPNYIGHRDYADPNTLARWRTVWFSGGQVFDLNEDLRVDLMDLALFCNEDWLWQACWLNLEELQMQQMASGGEDVMFMTNVDSMALDGMQTLSDPVEPQLSVEELIAKLEDSLVFLSRLWLEEPDLQQQISPEDWREFMLSVYQSLLDLKTQSFQIE
jgi:hypothetical protein